MAASLVLACLIFLFLLPSFISGSCLHTLPCNKSIQIITPFYFQPDNNTFDPNCTGYLGIGCHNEHPTFYWRELAPLESISYSTNTIRVSDKNLSSTLKQSGCGNLYFNFSAPVRNFFYGMYDPLYNSLSSLRCRAPNQTQSPPEILGNHYSYNLSYSPSINEGNETKKNCSQPNDYVPTFELVLMFRNNSPTLALLSASYSYNLAARPGCFTNSTEVLNCTEGCKGSQEEKRARKDIIIVGSVVGSAFLVAFFCSLLLLYQRNKLRLASSSSNLLVQRESSDQYFDDLDMAGSGYCTQIFTYKELQEATEGFSTSKELGNGGFGVVYKGKLKDERVVAVKRLHRTNYKRDQQFMNELEILSCLNHPNLVTLYGCCDARTSNELLLVYEFVPNGTVADHLHGRRCSEKTLTWPIRLSIAIETANALAYLHAIQPPIIHRDVKTNNILLDDNFHVKVGDFGLSRFLALDATHVSTAPQGTPGYVDPVYHQCYHLTDKSDVYSFGVVLVELISSKPAVDLNRSKDEINLANLALNKIQASQINELVDPVLGFSSNWDVERTVSLVAELAFRCLQYDRETRPSIREVLEALRGIERGNYGTRDKLLMDHMITKEETYLLKCDVNCISSDVMTDHSWKTSCATPDTSG